MLVENLALNISRTCTALELEQLNNAIDERNRRGATTGTFKTIFDSIFPANAKNKNK
jgi:hypothetical protein